ncbi:MAG: guanylate kinase [Verrucomicrobiales bacterium]|nr:guanylate kinase [Verrucomicrobiales bacterium]
MPAPTQPVLLLIAAPSGGGKTTVCQQLLATVPGLSRVVTCTTRPPRAGEQDGVDYHFLTEPDFDRRVVAGEFLDHARVSGHRYGTLQAEVLTRLGAERNVLLNVDVQGAASIRALAANVPALRAALVTVFLTPASLDVLAERLARRGQDAPDVMARRLAAARAEIAQWGQFDYLVPSTTMAEDLRRVRSILESEQLRTSRVNVAPAT